MAEALADRRPGDTVALDVLRDGQTVTVPATLSP